MLIARLILSLFFALLLALQLAIPVSAGDEGTPSAGVQLQNMEDRTITIDVIAYPQNGGPPSSMYSGQLPANASTTLYMPDFNLIGGGLPMLQVAATGRIGALTRVEWDVSTGAGIFSGSAPSTEVLVPIALADFANQTSEVTVQNTDTANTISDVKLTLLPRGGGSPIVLTNQTIPAATAKTWQLDNTSVWGALPDNALDLGSAGFMGSMLIESATPLMVHSFIDVENTPGISAFSGIAGDLANRRLYCPLVRDNYYGNTGINIVNNNGSPTEVTIKFRADPTSPNNITVNQPMTIAARSSAIAFQGPGGNTRAAGMPGGTQSTANTVPSNNGWFGSAEIIANQPIVAVVNDTLFGPGFSIAGQSSYNCVPDSEAGIKHFLPLLRRYHLQDVQLVSGIQVLDVSGSVNAAALNLVNWDGSDAPDPAPKAIAAGGAINFYGGDWLGLDTVPPSLGGYGWFGSGVITCSRACVVLVNDEHVTGLGNKSVDRANYIGLAR